MPVKKRVPNKTTKKTENTSRGLPDVSLPTEVSEPCESLGDFSMLLFGAKKIGKTTMCAQFPKALFLMFEPGGKALSVYQRRVKTWEEFKAYIKLLKKDSTFKTIVIDTADIMYELCFDYVCRKLVISHPSEESWGKGWRDIKQEMYSQVNELLNLEKGVIFISHVTQRTITRRDGFEYDVVESSMPKQAREVIEGLVDLWVLYDYQGSKRTLTIQGDDHVDSGHRIQGRFTYPDGEPIRSIDMGGSAKEAFQRFTLAFNNKLEKSKGGTDDGKGVVKKIKKGVVKKIKK